jgi:hypothetical protein
MNKISDTEIMNCLTKQYNKLIDQYGSDRILGIFAQGKVNCGFAESIQDLEAVACYLPTFEELCCSKPKSFVFHEEDATIKITDLRLGIFHPSYSKPYVLRMPYLEKEINDIFNLRSEILF